MLSSAAATAGRDGLSTRISIYTIQAARKVYRGRQKTISCCTAGLCRADFQVATRGLGLTGVVVVEASAWLEDNQWILDLARDNPIIKGFVGHLEPGDSFRQNL